MDPRDKIIKDLQKVLIRTIEENHKVILTADINEDAGYEFKTKLNDMMQEIGLCNIIQKFITINHYHQHMTEVRGALIL